MNKELSIKSSDDLTKAEISIKGVSVEILFLYFQLTEQLIKQEIATPELLKGEIDLCKFSDKLKTKLSEEEIQKIIRELKKGNNKNE